MLQMWLNASLKADEKLPLLSTAALRSTGYAATVTITWYTREEEKEMFLLMFCLLGRHIVQLQLNCQFLVLHC